MGLPGSSIDRNMEREGPITITGSASIAPSTRSSPANGPALKSRRAFGRIEFVGAQAVTGERCYPRRFARDEHARALYREEAQRQGIEGIYLRDLLQGKEVDLASLR